MDQGITVCRPADNSLPLPERTPGPLQPTGDARFRAARFLALIALALLGIGSLFFGLAIYYVEQEAANASKGSGDIAKVLAVYFGILTAGFYLGGGLVVFFTVRALFRLMKEQPPPAE
jgi:hypothetical protein